MGNLKFIKFCGRIAIVHDVLGEPPTDLNKVGLSWVEQTLIGQIVKLNKDIWWQ